MRVWLVVLALALGTTVSNGFARFGYGLILPAMRTDLDWSYATAGWLNTANAAGYLIGALLGLRLVGTMASGRMFRYGMCVTSVALLLSGFTEDVFVLIIWRILAGLGGAPVFISGGAIAAATFPSDPSRNALAIAIYFGGAGLGILLTAVSIPPLLEYQGASSWPYAWWALGVASFAALLPTWWATSGQIHLPQRSAGTSAVLRWDNIKPSLAGYFLFAAGYIIYMTFVVAWMRENGATLHSVIATWAILGIAVMLSSFVWKRVIAAYDSGVPLALSCFATALGVVLPLVYSGWNGLILSAGIFGLSFFIAPTAVTAFSKKNMPPQLWGSAVALYTTAFAIGQTIGPIGAGWLADETGNLSSGLMLGAGLLAMGGLLALFQMPLSNRTTA